MLLRYDVAALLYDTVGPGIGLLILFGNYRCRPHFLGGEMNAKVEDDYQADNGQVYWRRGTETEGGHGEAGLPDRQRTDPGGIVERTWRP